MIFKVVDSMTVWQVMKGNSDHARRKPRWEKYDLTYQHFSESTVREVLRTKRISCGDTMFVYWPGHMKYMGLQRAAEDGPYMATSDPDPDYPYIIKVCSTKWIGDLSDGIHLHEARKFLIGPKDIPGYKGLLDLSGFKGLNWMYRELYRRGAVDGALVC